MFRFQTSSDWKLRLILLAFSAHLVSAIEVSGNSRRTLSEETRERESLITEGLLKERVTRPDWKRILNERLTEELELPDIPTDWIPPEDADTRAQIAYWQRARADEPGPRAREKMLQAALMEPTLLPGLLDSLPQTEDAGKLVASRLDGLPRDTPEQRKQLAAVRAWVFQQTGMLRDEVLEDSREVDWRDFRWERPSPVFDALLDRDPEAAWMILKEFASGEDPELEVVGNLLLWQSGNQEADWRENLIEAAGDPTLPEEGREIASRALLKDEPQLRQAWMTDAIKSAAEIDLSGFAEVVWENPDRWIPVLTSLTGGNGSMARARAAALLTTPGIHTTRADALQPLLPWLADPDWTWEINPGRTRSRLIAQLRMVELPEAVGGLIKTLESDETLSLRAAAASTLAHYEAKEAVPAMKDLLMEEDLSPRDYDRVLRAVLKLKDHNPIERLGLIEEFLIEEQRSEGELGDDYFRNFRSKPKGIPGQLLISDLRRNPDMELFEAIHERAAEVRDTDPALSRIFQQLLQNSPMAHFPPYLVECLKDGSVSTRQLGNALRAATGDDWDGSPFKELIGEPGEVGGLAAVLSRDKMKTAKILADGDAKAQAAVLAAARITGDPLPLERVDFLLRGKCRLTQKAAEAYLKNRYDPEAARVYKAFVAGSESSPIHGPLGDMTSRIHRAFRTPPVDTFRRFGLDEHPLEIYALLSAGGWGSLSQQYLLVYPGEVVAVRGDGHERFGVARLSQSQFDKFMALIANYELDQLPPYYRDVDGGIVYEYIHATETDVWRVYMNNPPENESAIEWMLNRDPSGRPVLFYSHLVRAFKDLFREVEFEMGYGLNAPILIPREREQVQTVWKEGDDLRVLVKNPEKVLLWLGVDPQSGAILGPVEEPAGFEYLEADADIPHGFRYSKTHFGYPWRVRANDAFVRSGTFSETSGLWLTRRGAEPELLSEGVFLGETVSSDGKWCAVAKALGPNWATPNIVLLVHLETGRMTTVDLPPADTLRVITYLPEKERFLLIRSCKEGKDRAENPEYYTLAPETGELEKVSGIFWPLSRLASRPLQQVSDSPLYWAAIHGRLSGGKPGTTVGQYDRETFSFYPLIELPTLYFQSDNMWVDEQEGKIYAVIGEDLVRITM